MQWKFGFYTAAAVLLAVAVAHYRPAITQSGQKTAVPPDNAATNSLRSASGSTFRVPSDPIAKHWSLIAYGDMRFTDPSNTEATNPKVRRWLVDQIAREHPDALLLSGDVPYNGNVANDYDVYREEAAPWREAGIRVYPALGNHELRGPEALEPQNWWHAFPELKGRRWYSVEMANAYILTLDSNLSLDEGSRQRSWLEDQLGHLPRETKFVFVSLHHPPVADSIQGDSSHDVRANERQLATLLEKTAAGSSAKFLVIAGHIHNYQRFLQNGVVYLVSGGGGAKPYPIARTAADLYRDPAFPNYHYVKFVYDGKQLNATMYRVRYPEGATAEWEAKDTFTVTLNAEK
ncbi:MAG TPA: metallophosphoesterase [Acidisarcina sp.]|nr:metallophosphoesterase [Acidisarcina sp.]